MTRKPTKRNQKSKTPTADKLRKIADGVAEIERRGVMVIMDSALTREAIEVTMGPGAAMFGLEPDEYCKLVPGRETMTIAITSCESLSSDFKLKG